MSLVFRFKPDNMVPKRSCKFQFFEGERVLCYEPDPTKAKVLYDSKVLDVVVNKDHRGRKTIEYLIHFQGWNSSWDRCVGEEFVLKDSAENRQLQRDLAEKSQLQLGAYLYRKERKKDNQKVNYRIGHSSEDGSSDSPARIDTDDGQISTSSDDDSSLEEDYIPIDLTNSLRNILENDFQLVTTGNKLHRLPAEPTVASILEIYFQQFVSNLSCNSNGKFYSRYRNSFGQQKLTSDDVKKRIQTCKEMLDGLRLYFDYTLEDLLLYNAEKSQVPTAHASYTSEEQENNPELDYDEYNHSSYSNNNTFSEDYNESNQHDLSKIERRRTLRSNTNTEFHTNGSSPSIEPPNNKCNSSASNNYCVSSRVFKLLPDYIYKQQPAPPCLIYGATHLTRLLVKMPELLGASSIIESNLKKLLKFLEPFIIFLNEHKQWYGDRHYINV